MANCTEKGYEDRLKQYVELHTVVGEKVKENNVLLHAKKNHVMDAAVFKSWCAKAKAHECNVDFVIIKLIRLLHFEGSGLESTKAEIDKILSTFAFWTCDKKATPHLKQMGKVIFWSENHAFMFLSSAYLFLQRAKELNLTSLAGEREVNMLKVYLDAHYNFGGIYEVLSGDTVPIFRGTLCVFVGLSLCIIFFHLSTSGIHIPIFVLCMCISFLAVVDCSTLSTIYDLRPSQPLRLCKG